jgi:predicted nucleotidyltransferase component of viral defense system
MNFTPAQQTHVNIMRAVLRTVQDTPLVLKGGTALLLCYGLDRFSEDLDFDATKKLNLESRIEHALQPVTDTVQRYRIEYAAAGNEGRLKVEISCRDAIHESDVTVRAGIRTWQASRLIAQKLNALAGRTAARDLYDIHFLARNFRKEWTADSLARLRSLLSDVNSLESRFRPAFEEDDLFRERSELLPGLILEIQEALPSQT